MYTTFISLLLIFITIPIHTKISIPKLSPRVSSIFTKQKEEITHHEFNAVKKLELTNEYGNISVETWKQPCVMIELRKKGAQQFLQDTKLKSCKTEHDLTAHVVLNADNSKGTVNIHILVPDQLPLKLTTQHGTINIKPHNGPLDLTTQWGNITIKDGTNTVLAKTIQGNILVQRKTIKQGHALNLQADHGNITLQVPQEFAADMQAHTNHGKINSTLFISLHPQTILLNDETFKQMKHHVHGWIGQPQDQQNSATVLMQTVYGMINIIPYNGKTK